MAGFKVSTLVTAIALSCAVLVVGCKREKPLAIGEKAPAISVLDLNDRTVKLSDFKGNVVVVQFWASGCGACVAEMSLIDKLSKRYQGRGLAVFAINMGDSRESVKKFIKILNISYPVLLDPVLIAAKKYGVSAVPTTFFIDRNGIARKVVVGEVMPDLLERTIGELL